MKFTLENVERLDHAYDESIIFDGYFDEPLEPGDVETIRNYTQLSGLYIWDYLVMNEQFVIALDEDGMVLFVQDINEWHDQMLEILKGN